MLNKILVVTIAAMLLLPAIGGAVAQGGGIISPGETISSRIDDTNYFDLWSYKSPGDEVLSVAVEVTRGSLETELAVMTESKSAIAISETGKRIRNFHVASADIVYIYVSRVGGKNGSSVGDYDISLSSGDGGTILLDVDKIETSPEVAVAHLIELGVIPDMAAKRGIFIPTGAFIEIRRANIDFGFVNVGRLYDTKDFVLHTNIIFTGDHDFSCGLSFRVQTRTNFDGYDVPISRAGSAEFGIMPGGDPVNWQPLERWDVDNLDRSDGEKNQVVLTMVDDEGHLFINGELIARFNDTHYMDQGAFFIEIKDAVPYARCSFHDYWVYALE